MKKSLKPTEYLIIKAMSEWESCDFALIHITEEWRNIVKTRLERVKAFEMDEDLKWLNYADTSHDFFQFSNENYPEVQEWLLEEEMVYLSISKEEIDKFQKPDYKLNCYQMQVFKDGDAIFNAFGKDTQEEFWTVQFSLSKLINNEFYAN